ncbi:phosphatasepp1 regulatory subunit [Culex quinquefasciatus]|uniref:Centrosomal protein of 97 kDa n=2 Tax=Culex pipiens complex TaxID=518105 RepID=B0W735_CULQU|nr:phosphatasepp1 regulatory subunit [Culex quinquefasciatus]|eukprot:XP_001844519.1 phosphatasepp1 regulatory subunit [Culex quinquefasciatus]
MEIEVDSQKLDLAKKCLKKIPKSDDAQQFKVLILDDNELQKIDNIDSYLKIEKLSLCKNQLLRMYGVCRLHCLRELNLSYNGILTIEGLKDLIHLTHLNLEGNNIKTIEHLNTNGNLEYLNLSENSIGIISDISFLKNLKELYMNGNRIAHLRQCDKYLPLSLETLTLAKNNISDLNEICTLSHLNNLNSITISDNPCVLMTGNSIGFDYRPFVLNWCMSVKAIDGFVVTAIESLKAEWLYSQGRGRQFRVGEQTALARYLSTVCPLSGEALENENERKLRLILSKAQQHQRQLQEQNSGGGGGGGGGDGTATPVNNSPSSLRRKGQTSRIQSPRVTRLSGRQNSPDTMSSSYHGNTSNNLMTSSHMENNTSGGGASQLFELTKSLIDNITSDGSNIMTQSLDPTMLNTSGNNAMNASMHESIILTKQTNSNLYNDQPPASTQIIMGGPLAAASKILPVPESLMSPDCGPTTIVQRNMQNCANQPQPQTPQIPKAIKTKDNSRSGGIPTGKSSPRPQKRSTSTNNSTSNSVSSERSSPSLSPRKTMVNNAVNNQHSRQPKQQQQHSVQATPPDGGSSNAVSSDEDSEAINIDKLKTIRNKVAQQSQVCQAFSGGAGKPKEKDCVDSAAAASLNNKTTENSAILIQKIWRGYMSRKRGQNIADILQKKRTQDYIVKLTKDMEMTKTALENERKIQQLQMQAINALWKKVSAMQPSQAANGTTDTMKLDVINNENSSVLVVQDLTKTCSMLMNQVQQLQTSVKDIVNCMQFFANMPQGVPNPAAAAAASLSTASEANLKDSCETQTEIVAVHTPQVEQLPAFPFRSSSSSSKLARPSTLPISSSETSPKITSQDGQPIVEETEAETKEEAVVEIEADPGDTEENDDGEQKEQDEKELQEEEEEVVAVEEEPSESQN